VRITHVTKKKPSPRASITTSNIRCSLARLFPGATIARYGKEDCDLRHVRYPNIFALGEAASTTNAKTAAAVAHPGAVCTENLIRVDAMMESLKLAE
jgi:hypothetical protein